MLIMQPLPQAIMFNVVIIMVVFPPVSMAFAIVLGTLHQIESLTPRRFKFLVAIERYVSYVSFSDYFDSGDLSTMLPVTKWRSRPAMDWYDAVTYGRDHVTRVYRSY